MLGPDYASYIGNNGCGISMASASSLSGPWTVQPLKITDQWTSEEIYCAHSTLKYLKYVFAHTVSTVEIHSLLARLFLLLLETMNCSQR